MTYTIRKLTQSNVDAYKGIRLEALKLSSENYGSSYEDEAKEDDAFFIHRLTDGYIYSAFNAGKIVATLGFYQNKGRKRKHVGNIWGVYTKPEHRRKKLSKQLLNMVYKELPEDIKILHLGVRATNTIAHEFYKREGFRQYGVDEKATKIGDEYIDEILMMKIIK